MERQRLLATIYAQMLERHKLEVRDVNFKERRVFMRRNDGALGGVVVELPSPFVQATRARPGTGVLRAMEDHFGDPRNLRLAALVSSNKSAEEALHSEAQLVMVRNWPDIRSLMNAADLRDWRKQTRDEYRMYPEPILPVGRLPGRSWKRTQEITPDGMGFSPLGGVALLEFGASKHKPEQLWRGYDAMRGCFAQGLIGERKHKVEGAELFTVAYSRSKGELVLNMRRHEF